MKVLDKKKEKFECEECHKTCNYSITLSTARKGVKKVCLDCAARLAMEEFDNTHSDALFKHYKRYIIKETPLSRKVPLRLSSYNENIEKFPFLEKIFEKYKNHPFIKQMKNKSEKYEITQKDLEKIHFFVANTDIFCSESKINYYKKVLFILGRASSKPFFSTFLVSIYNQFKKSHFLTKKQLEVVDKTIKKYQNKIALYLLRTPL